MTAEALVCGSCGTELLPNSKFCSECGAGLGTAPTPAEYKQVTVLFADVVRSMAIAAAVDMERLREIMTELVERSAAVVRRYGGGVVHGDRVGRANQLASVAVARQLNGTLPRRATIGQNTVAHVNAFAAATGIGSWPGTSARAAAEVVVGELHSLPHLVELPARGVGADMIGRAGALLVDIAIDTTPRGYRITARRGAAARRASSFLDEDIDALEEAWEKAGLRAGGRTVKVQAPGPVTLAAQLELPNGHRAITDAGALRDLTTSLAEGVAAHRVDVARRLECPVVVQFDEPLLPAALAGRLTGVTALTPVHPVDETTAVQLLDECVAATGGDVAVHCCATELPWDVLQRSMIQAISVDVSGLATVDLDGLGEFVDSGRTAMLGMVSSVAPERSIAATELAQRAAKITDRLGLPRRLLTDRVGITPACGLAGATSQWARTAIGLAQAAVDAMRRDPEEL